MVTMYYCWEAKQTSLTWSLRDILQVPSQGPKSALQSTSLNSDPCSTWLHVSLLFESENGEMTIEEGQRNGDIACANSQIQLMFPFEPDDKGFVAATFGQARRYSQWYNSKWLGTYYDERTRLDLP